MVLEIFLKNNFTGRVRDNERKTVGDIIDANILSKIVNEYIANTLNGSRALSTNKTAVYNTQIVRKERVVEILNKFQSGDLQKISIYDIFGMSPNGIVEKNSILIKILERMNLSKEDIKRERKKKEVEFLFSDVEFLLRENGLYYPLMSLVLDTLNNVREKIKETNNNTDIVSIEQIIHSAAQKTMETDAITVQYGLSMKKLYLDYQSIKKLLEMEPERARNAIQNAESIDQTRRELVDLLPNIQVVTDKDLMLENMMIRAERAVALLSNLSKEEYWRVRAYIMQIPMSLAFEMGIKPSSFFDETDPTRIEGGKRGLFRKYHFSKEELKIMDNIVGRASRIYGKDPFNSKVEGFFTKNLEEIFMPKNHINFVKLAKEILNKIKNVVQKLNNRVFKKILLIFFHKRDISRDNIEQQTTKQHLLVERELFVEQKKTTNQKKESEDIKKTKKDLLVNEPRHRDFVDFVNKANKDIEKKR